MNIPKAEPEGYDLYGENKLKQGKNCQCQSQLN